VRYVVEIYNLVILVQVCHAAILVGLYFVKSPVPYDVDNLKIPGKKD
jgi:hypothetical protein